MLNDKKKKGQKAKQDAAKPADDSDDEIILEDGPMAKVETRRVPANSADDSDSDSGDELAPKSKSPVVKKQEDAKSQDKDKREDVKGQLKDRKRRNKGKHKQTEDSSKRCRKAILHEMAQLERAGDYIELAQLAESFAAMARSAAKGQSVPPKRLAKHADRLKAKRKAQQASKASALKPAPDVSKELQVSVTNLPWRLTEDALREHFAECGPVEKLWMPVRIKHGPDSTRGFAKIRFLSQSSVDKAVALNGSDLGGRPLCVTAYGAANAKSTETAVASHKETSTSEPKKESKLQRSLLERRAGSREKEASSAPKKAKKQKVANSAQT